ncbi:MAG: hypothetical protein HYU51_14660 [Candidatus Rokubacteria bacterium]|nr:hypothetical protein [Candidatus Rokubacteria bacterium]
MPPGAARLACGVTPLLAGTPWALNGALAAGLATCAALGELGALPSAAAAAAAVTAGHGLMLATALCWAEPAGRGDARRDAFTAVGLIALGAAAAGVHPSGGVVYLVIPVWLGRLVATGRLTGLGLATRVSPRVVALGAGLGAFLGAHMLLTASLTYGYQPLERGVLPAMRALAYDAGVQVVATECFFRGALFDRMQRRWSFAAACALSTAGTVARYLVDPLLPQAVEMIAGTIFYTGVLAIGNAWLFWRFGTLIPGLVASLTVFVAYRMLPVE